MKTVFRLAPTILQVHLFAVGLFVLLVWSLGGCTSSRPVPALLRPVSLDSLERVARLPAYLVPPPATATRRQAQAWRDAQTRMLGNVGAPAGKMKLKNVGNTDDHSKRSVQHGITGRQLTTGFVLLGVVALLLWLGPRFVGR